MTRNHSRPAAALLAALLAAAALSPACSKQGADSRQASRVKIRELGISFTPPPSWSAADQGLLEEARRGSAGKTQVGAFDAYVLQAYFGPSGGQLVFSSLKPNARFSASRGFGDQFTAYAEEVRSALEAPGGRLQESDLRISVYAVHRIAGSDAQGRFTKLLFSDRRDGKKVFMVDAFLPPAESDAEALSDSILSIK